jgi:hypothetical protein
LLDVNAHCYGGLIKIRVEFIWVYFMTLSKAVAEMTTYATSAARVATLHHEIIK